MPEKEGSTSSERSTGFLDTCKSVVAAITSALHTRLELFVTELEEERERLKQALLLTLLLFFGLSFGFILLNILWSRFSGKRAGSLPLEGSPRSTSASE
jgi:uncharacterized membrane protein YqjE